VPLHLFLEITSACNLNCSHCYVRAGEGAVRQLSVATVYDLFDEFADLGGQMVSISGGEPTIHKGWREVLGRSSALSFETMLLSNGTKLTSEDVSYLRRSGARSP
jgi:MoaA/NifB/PqqE/SkfB family radical SAM enzyme